MINCHGNESIEGGIMSFSRSTRGRVKGIVVGVESKIVSKVMGYEVDNFPKF